MKHDLQSTNGSRHPSKPRKQPNAVEKSAALGLILHGIASIQLRLARTSTNFHQSGVSLKGVTELLRQWMSPLLPTTSRANSKRCAPSGRSQAKAAATLMKNANICMNTSNRPWMLQLIPGRERRAGTGQLQARAAVCRPASANLTTK